MKFSYDEIKESVSKIGNVLKAKSKQLAMGAAIVASTIMGINAANAATNDVPEFDTAIVAQAKAGNNNVKNNLNLTIPKQVSQTQELKDLNNQVNKVLEQALHNLKEDKKIILQFIKDNLSANSILVEDFQKQEFTTNDNSPSKIKTLTKIMLSSGASWEDVSKTLSQVNPDNANNKFKEIYQNISKNKLEDVNSKIADVSAKLNDKNLSNEKVFLAFNLIKGQKIQFGNLDKKLDTYIVKENLQSLFKDFSQEKFMQDVGKEANINYKMQTAEEMGYFDGYLDKLKQNTNYVVDKGGNSVKINPIQAEATMILNNLSSNIEKVGKSPNLQEDTLNIAFDTDFNLKMQNYGSLQNESNLKQAKEAANVFREAFEAKQEEVWKRMEHSKDPYADDLPPEDTIEQRLSTQQEISEIATAELTKEFREAFEAKQEEVWKRMEHSKDPYADDLPPEDTIEQRLSTQQEISEIATAELTKEFREAFEAKQEEVWKRMEHSKDPYADDLPPEDTIEQRLSTQQEISEIATAELTKEFTQNIEQQLNARDLKVNLDKMEQDLTKVFEAITYRQRQEMRQEVQNSQKLDF